MSDEERQALLERFTEIKARLERLKAEKAEKEGHRTQLDASVILLSIASSPHA